MDKKESIQKFTAALVILAKIVPQIQDEFFVRKFYRKLFQLTSAYVGFAGAGASSDVAQYRSECLHSIKEILELLEYFSHLKLVQPTPLLPATHALLRLKLAVLEPARANVPQAIQPEEKKKSVPQAPAKPKTSKASGLNLNQEKIFHYVKKFPDVRTKDVIEQFSAVSERTVKRNLKELVRSGLLRRRSENKAVFYSAVDISA